jgi:hypothetical protein|tara:strand:+ start:7363 stop:7920 length:558 start_codon:yes stop_codon:yes gene_type:complete
MTDKCFECGETATCNHHVIPKSVGGTKTVPLCTDCHANAHTGSGLRKVIKCIKQNNLNKQQMPSSFPPLGYYKVQKDKLIRVSKKYSKIVQEMFQMSADGSSLYDIRDHLKDTYDIKRCRQTVGNMLRNKIYIGEQKHSDQVFETPAMRIVDTELFDKVQAALDSRCPQSTINFRKKIVKPKDSK